MQGGFDLYIMMHMQNKCTKKSVSSYLWIFYYALFSTKGPYAWMIYF